MAKTFSARKVSNPDAVRVMVSLVRFSTFFYHQSVIVLTITRDKEIYIYYTCKIIQEYYRVPTAQGKREKWPPKIPGQGKHREFGNFAKTAGILFARVVNSLILKLKDSCCENFHFFSRSWICLQSQFGVCNKLQIT